MLDLTGPWQTRSNRSIGAPCILCSDGRINTELNHRIGMARADFDKLSRVWSHASISCNRKVEVFNACVASKLMYCLNTAWLNSAELTKLDAFQAKCLRKIAGVKPSYWSRVSNESVRAKLCCEPLSRMLLQQQLIYFGKLARNPTGDVLRDAVFKPYSYSLCETPGRRRKGRPRKCWGQELYNISLRVESNMWDATTWKTAVQKYCLGS